MLENNAAMVSLDHIIEDGTLRDCLVYHGGWLRTLVNGRSATSNCCIADAASRVDALVAALGMTPMHGSFDLRSLARYDLLLCMQACESYLDGLLTTEALGELIAGESFLHKATQLEVSATRREVIAIRDEFARAALLAGDQMRRATEDDFSAGMGGQVWR